MSQIEPLKQAEHYLDLIARSAMKSGATFATCESLTGGQIAAHMASAKDSGDWFKGGIVAYQSSVKYELLNVPHGPVVSATAASTMARSTSRILGADFTVAVTGAGGPDPQDGQPMGTVFIAAIGPEDYELVTEHHFPGTVEEVLEATIIYALAYLSLPVQP